MFANSENLHCVTMATLPGVKLANPLIAKACHSSLGSANDFNGLFSDSSAVSRPCPVENRGVEFSRRFQEPGVSETFGYLSTVQARARVYSRQVGARLAPFGVDMPEAIEAIAAAARSIGIEPDEVWCASGSGVLARALAKAWPKARRHVVQVGRRLEPNEVAGAMIHVYPLPFEREARSKPPFPSDPHYDAKAWEICRARKDTGKVIMWNVAGPAQV